MLRQPGKALFQMVSILVIVDIARKGYLRTTRFNIHISFNPCYCGYSSKSLRWVLNLISVSVVSILVIVDIARKVCEEFDVAFQYVVSILVIVDIARKE